MRLSMWSSYFVDLSPEDMVLEFARAGWRESEFSDEHGAVLLERGDPEPEGAAFRRYAADHGLAFPQGHLWLSCNIAEPDSQAIVDRLRPWLDLFVAVGVTAGVLHPGHVDAAEPEVLMERRVRVLDALAAHLGDTPFDICLENVDYLNSAEDLRALIDAAGGRHLAICLDTGHLNMPPGDRDQAGFIRRAGGLLKALHLADNEGRRDQHLMPFGRGTVPWREVFEALDATGYRGPYNVEVPGERHAPLPIRRAKLDYLKRAFELAVDPACWETTE